VNDLIKPFHLSHTAITAAELFDAYLAHPDLFGAVILMVVFPALYEGRA
jgi:hypothetical protein